MTLRRAVFAVTFLFCAAASAQESAASIGSPSTSISTEPELRPVMVDPKTTFTMGDLPDNAFTNRAGTLVLHPFQASALSITDQAELKTSLLGLVGGANLALEYRLLSDEDNAFALEPSGLFGWTGRDFGAGLTARYTRRMAGLSYVTVNAGGQYRRTIGNTSVTQNIEVPVSLVFDFQTDPHTIWQLHGRADVMDFLPGGYRSGVAGFSWNHSFGGVFQLGLGLNFLIGGVPQELIDTLAPFNVTLPTLFALPVPDLTLGFKF